MSKIKKLVSMLLAFAMVLSLATTGMFALSASAEETEGETTEETWKEGLTFDIIGQKTATQLGAPGRYEISVSVPGVKSSETYNEIIVMVDASSSQEKNFDNLKNLIIGLGEQVLTEDASMKLTLMGFGVGPRNAGSFYSVDQLHAFLDTATQDDLLQERSATNCEVGFEFVREYIEASPNLEHTIVVYTSDGAANMDESLRYWDQWETNPNFFNWSTTQIISYVAGVEAGSIFAGNAPMSYTRSQFRAECLNVELAKLFGIGSDAYQSSVEYLYNAIVADAANYITNILKSVYAYNGFTWGEGYSCSDMEYAFQQYYLSTVGRDNEYFDSYLDTFYILCAKKSDASRAAAASLALQANDKVLGLYHVGYTGASSTWMNPEKGYYGDNDISKLTYVYNTDFASVVEDMVGLGSEIVTMEYRDVTVTDPMSEWVILDESTIRIVDDSTGTVLWQNGAWLTEVELTAETPITVTTNADGMRQITWKIKDGPLLYTDCYSLRYTVDVNEKAEGFEYGVEYPANGPTTFRYTDHTRRIHQEEIAVPYVDEVEVSEDLVEGDIGIRIHKEEADTRKPIEGISFNLYKVVPEEGVILSAVPTAEEIAAYAVEENLVAELTTDTYGYAAAKLEEGTYLIVELENDKVVAPVAPFYVDLPAVDPETDEEIEILDIYPKNELKPVEPEVPDPEIPVDPEPDPIPGQFSIVKHDAADAEVVLSGAQFQVLRLAQEGEEGTEYTYGGQTILLVPVVDENGEPVVLTTDETGAATSPELEQGLYFLLETKSPAGYYLLEDLIPVYANPVTDTVEALLIPNTIMPQLPSAGGMGTTLIYGLGILLMLGAAALLLNRKRTKAC